MVESIPYGLIEISLALLVRASFQSLRADSMASSLMIFLVST